MGLVQVVEGLHLLKHLLVSLDVFLEFLFFLLQVSAEQLVLVGDHVFAVSDGGLDSKWPDLHQEELVNVMILVHIRELLKHFVVLLNFFEDVGKSNNLHGCLCDEFFSLDQFSFVLRIVTDSSLHELVAFLDFYYSIVAIMVRGFENSIFKLQGLVCQLILQLLCDDTEDVEVHLIF